MYTIKGVKMEATKDELIEDKKTELNDDDVLYGIKEPFKSCKRCYGTGRTAFDENGDPVLCSCLKRNGKGDWITVAAFRQICITKRSHYERFNNDSGDHKVHTPEATSKSEET